MAQKYIEGDLVMTRTEPNNFTPNGVVCKFIDYDTRDKVLIRNINGIDVFVVEKGQIVPIPLNSDILEKNGWKIEDVNPHDFSDFVSKGILYRAIKDKEILFFQKGASVFTCPLNWRRIEIKYVHQLQHLLFGQIGRAHV